MFGWTPLSLGGKHIPWRPWLKEIDMPRGFLCPITEGPCENGSCTRTRCSEQTSLEGRAELERMAYESGVLIDPMTLIDPDPEKPVEGETETERPSTSIVRRVGGDPALTEFATDHYVISTGISASPRGSSNMRQNDYSSPTTCRSRP
jgi:hypothetical protein